MSPKELLVAFESKYPFLYDQEVNGVPLYTCHRDSVLALLRGGAGKNATYTEEKGCIYPRRILDSAVKLLRFRGRKTLVFTSAMYRRDNGRNLAAEYLLEKYPDGVIFEWPHRVEAYDSAYFADENRDRYCPLDFYLVIYKLYARIFKKKYDAMVRQFRVELTEAFEKAPASENEREQAAIDYLMEQLPESCGQTACSQAVFRWLFKGYRKVERAIDFWGSARENIIPVLPGEPESIELQHGVITAHHPGYMYPSFLKGKHSRFFDRTLLVYGEKTKQQLTRDSVFTPEQVCVIGNPRIIRYKALFAPRDAKRRLILFTSQPYEQDGVAVGYYDNAIAYLKQLQACPGWADYTLAVKLHPRENDGAAELYRKALPDVPVYGNASQLYELLCQSVLQVTVSSTSLYEAAEFDTPTLAIAFAGEDHRAIFGFTPWIAQTPEDLPDLMDRLSDPAQRAEYTAYLKEMTKQYM